MCGFFFLFCLLISFGVLSTENDTNWLLKNHGNLRRVLDSTIFLATKQNLGFIYVRGDMNFVFTIRLLGFESSISKGHAQTVMETMDSFCYWYKFF